MNLDTREHDGSHITKGEARRIESYVAKVLKRLDLGYWRVYVAQNLPPEDCAAMIEPTDGRRIAMLFIHEDWAEKKVDEQRHTLIHEAIHLMHHDQEYAVRRFVDGCISAASDDALDMFDLFKVETERMVDSLTFALTPFMPKWTKAS